MFLEYDELIIYKELADDPVLALMCECLSSYSSTETRDMELARKQLVGAIRPMVAYCEERALKGNLWSAYLTDRLLNAENAYTYACEANADTAGSIADLVLHDMEIIFRMFNADLKGALKALGLSGLEIVLDYVPACDSRIYSVQIRDRICDLAEQLACSGSAIRFKDILTRFYIGYGAGALGLHRAFSIEADRDGAMHIVPVLNMIPMTLDDLVGYENAKHKLTENTEAFVEKKPANNCLLYGDAGTGKSSCIRALATQYYNRGLRIIQVHRDQFEYLSELISVIKNRNYRFIIYMDDLSFEDFETDYKYLKAVIEGGLEQRPGNVLIYATSNRRHLIKETSSDRNDYDEDMHRSDTMAEKLSLSQRFGVQIYFGAPVKKEYDLIVTELAKRAGINMSEDELILEANKWELSHGGRSGRTARQFIDHLLGCGQEG
ncbi:MAG: ATP-binding protein [Lachnospiraceae bacterium]|nr:ATP-binding protein [Lachnospiraceae bacterium]